MMIFAFAVGCFVSEERSGVRCSGGGAEAARYILTLKSQMVVFSPFNSSFRNFLKRNWEFSGKNFPQLLFNK